MNQGDMAVRYAFRTTLVVLTMVAGCLFQDFSDLQQGAGGSYDSNDGGGSRAAGGSTNSGKNAGGSSHTGGSRSTGASGGTAISTNQGGTAGITSATTVTPSGGSTVSGGASSTGGSSALAGGGAGGVSLGANLLTNPSFETDLAGWTISTQSVADSRYVFAQYPTTGSTTVDGLKEFSAWSDTAEYSVSVYQTVNGLVQRLIGSRSRNSRTQFRSFVAFIQ